MSVGPRRRTNPIEEWGVKLGVLAGRSSGGGVGAEQRRIPPTSANLGAGLIGGGMVVPQDEPFTGEPSVTFSSLPAGSGSWVVVSFTVLFTTTLPDVVAVELAPGSPPWLTVPAAPTGHAAGQLILPTALWQQVPSVTLRWLDLTDGIADLTFLGSIA